MNLLFYGAYLGAIGRRGDPGEVIGPRVITWQVIR